MNELQNLDENNNLEAFCKKVDFLFRCLAIHAGQIMSMTADYVAELNNKPKLFDKKRFFQLIEVKTDYAECVLNLIDALNDETTSLDKNKIDYYRHHLVIQVAKDIQSSRRWSKLLLSYQSASNEKFTHLWRESLKRFEQLSYLV